MTLPAYGLVLVVVASVTASLMLYRLLARKQVLDHPNERSSHIAPTPKGGGIGFIPVICLALILATFHPETTPAVPIFTLALWTAAISLLGLADDLKELAAGPRLIIQCLAGTALVTVVLIYSPGESYPLGTTLSLGGAALLFLLWSTNLYNFMDGIDGLAAIQAVLAGALVFALELSGLYPGALATAGLVAALSCLAFLCFNFPPAGMFMGDAGSAALGFLFAGLAILEFPVSADAFWIWIIALAGFIADATVTLFIRLFRGERIHEAHRSHFYQLWTRHLEDRLLAGGANGEQARARAHRRYLLLFTGVFVIWQLPCALLVASGLLGGFPAATLCLLALMTGVFLGGAGGRRRLTSDA